MPVEAIVYMLVMLSLIIGGIIIDQRREVAQTWLALDIVAALCKAAFIANFYYKFVPTTLLIVLILFSAFVDISTYFRDYRRVKKTGGIVGLFFAYLVTTLVLAPAYFFAILAV